MRSVITIILSVFLFSCGETRQPQNSVPAPPSKKPANADCAVLEREARHHDSILMNAVEEDPAVAKRAIAAFTGFAFHCSTHTLAPVFLIKTAQVARAI